MTQSKPTMTLAELKNFNNTKTEAYERGEIDNLAYYNARMFVLISIQKGKFLPEEEVAQN